MITIIVVVDQDGGIGLKGKLPWDSPEDMRYFKETTMGKSVIMGRVTWEGLPKRPLQGRRNIVISSKPVFGAESYRTLEEAIDRTEGERFIIGGSMLYEYALKEGLVDKIVVSEIEGEYETDSRFNWELAGTFCVDSVKFGEDLVVTTYKKY